MNKPYMETIRTTSLCVRTDKTFGVRIRTLDDLQSVIAAIERALSGEKKRGKLVEEWSFRLKDSDLDVAFWLTTKGQARVRLSHPGYAYHFEDFSGTADLLDAAAKFRKLRDAWATKVSR